MFRASQPLRYLAFVVSRFARAETATVAFPPRQDGGPASVPLVGPSYSSLNLSVEANPRQVQRGRELGDRAADIALFYHSLIGDVPYSASRSRWSKATCLAGTAPATSRRSTSRCRRRRWSWRNDPAAFEHFPDFFLAHELAHQWWGQAVGWRNYHEQWLSEGFAQYFAALYAQKQRATTSSRRVLRQLRKWGMDNSDQGPVYLGYRLGHVRDEAASFARWSTTRARRCSTCCGAWSATSRSSAGCAASTARRGSTRPARRNCGPRWRRRPAVARALLRALDLRVDAAEAEGRLSHRRNRTSSCRSSRSARCSTCR